MKKTKSKKSRISSKTQNKIRYAVVGQGYFAQIAILPAFAHAKNSELKALVSGDPEKLKKLSRKYDVSSCYAYDEYDDLLQSGEIDAVYIALPNPMHCDFAVRAVRAGIHVLCEKPMALSAKDCEVMIREARHHDVKLMIAYRLHFEEANLKAVESLESGKLGEPRFFSALFSMPVKDDNIRAAPFTEGGGPLYDIGIYCLNAARYLFRDEPIEVFAMSRNRGRRDVKLDNETFSAMMRFPDDRLATFTCDYGAASTGYFHVVGTKGDLCLDNAFEFAGEKTEWLTVNEKTRTKTYAMSDQIAPELIYFSECIQQNREPEPSGVEGLADIRVIEALWKSAETGKMLSLEKLTLARRPSVLQERKKPAVQKEKLINAEEPS